MAFESAEPETRLSLLVRLGSAEDQAAWTEFVAIYHPVIYRAARCRGLQHADAQDVAQQVLISVGRSLAQRPHDPRRARFRTWLATVTRNAAIDAIRSRKAHAARGDSQAAELLRALPCPDVEREILEDEYQKELFRRAARTVEAEFAPESWQAFWRTTVEQQPVAQVAAALGKRAGSIYAARSRIMRRLREEIERLRADDPAP